VVEDLYRLVLKTTLWAKKGEGNIVLRKS